MSAAAASATALGKREAAAALVKAVLPHVLFWGVLVWTLGIPYWITVAVAVPAGTVLGSTFVALRDPQAPPRR